MPNLTPNYYTNPTSPRPMYPALAEGLSKLHLPTTGGVVQPNGNTGIVPPNLIPPGASGGGQSSLYNRFQPATPNRVPGAFTPQAGTGQALPEGGLRPNLAPLASGSLADRIAQMRANRQAGHPNRPGTGGAGPRPGTGPGSQLPGSGMGPNSGVVAPPNAPPSQFGAGQVVQDFLTQFTSNDSPYIQQARQSGIEMANSRGLLNSSIAGGNAVREAIKAAQPFVSEATGLLKSREGYAAQDWINSNQFNREFSGALALLPIKSSYDMLNTLMSYGAENPQIYTPEVMSGYSNFFQSNMQDIMSHYYGGVA